MKKSEMEKILQNIQNMTYQQIIAKYPYYNPIFLMAVRKGYIRKKRAYMEGKVKRNRFTRKIEVME